MKKVEINQYLRSELFSCFEGPMCSLLWSKTKFATHYIIIEYTTWPQKDSKQYLQNEKS